MPDDGTGKKAIPPIGAARNEGQEIKDSVKDSGVPKTRKSKDFPKQTKPSRTVKP